mmetsp:Transcript_91143/g.258094  ORF Transcript_91143/g.258094 Transcript_91143/m.258094 type:complete len:304 (+) Transcript_91143:160-1071(+)
MCMNGRMAPELFVIGGAKAGTSTLCGELRRSPALVWPKKGDCDAPSPAGGRAAAWKEGHYLDYGYQDGLQAMLDDYPPCTYDQRLVGVDGTARYSGNPFVPARLAAWYGPLRWNLKFILLLREPLERLHSDYHHGRHDRTCPDFAMMSFGQIMRRILMYQGREYRASGPWRPGCSSFLEGSLYASHLDRWLRDFGPKQFLVVPFKYNTAGARQGTVAEHIWSLLGVRGQRGPKLHLNQGLQHRALQEDLDPATTLQMREFLYRETGPDILAGALARTDVHLYGLPEGGGRAPGDISAWIRANW